MSPLSLTFTKSHNTPLDFDRQNIKMKINYETFFVTMVCADVKKVQKMLSVDTAERFSNV